MAVTRIRKFSSVLELETLLNGGLIVGAVPPGGIYGLVGKTLKFTQPSAVTVTFVASSGVGGSAEAGLNPDPQILMLKDLKLQIEAAIPAVSVRTAANRLLLVEATPTNGVTIDNTGTANVFLGIDDTGSTAGKIFAPPPSATPPCWTFSLIDSSNSIVLFTLE